MKKEIKKSKALSDLPNRLDEQNSIKLDKLHSLLSEYFGVSKSVYLSSRKDNLVMIRNIGIYTGVVIAKINKDKVMESFKRHRTMIYHSLRSIDCWFESEKFYKDELDLLQSFLQFYMLNCEKNQDVPNPVFIGRLEVIDKTGRAYVNMGVSSMQFSLQDENKTLKIFIK